MSGHLFVGVVLMFDQHHRKARLSLLASLVQLAMPFCILLFFVLLFCSFHAWQWLRQGVKSDPHRLTRRLKVATYAVSNFFYTSLAQAALNQLFMLSDSPILDGCPYRQFLQVLRTTGVPAVSAECNVIAVGIQVT